MNNEENQHPEPSRYAKPEAVLEQVKDRDERIGACADLGHWMRGNIKPLEALRLLSGRIVDLHLKDRNDFGIQGTDDVPVSAGKVGLRDLLAELTLQNYRGYLTIEYEREAEAFNPDPAIRKSVEFIKSVTYYEGYIGLQNHDSISPVFFRNIFIKELE